MNFIWSNEEISLKKKYQLCMEITVDFALWNGKTWSGNASDLELLDRFHHESIGRMLKIRMSQVRDGRIRGCEKTIQQQMLQTIWHLEIQNPQVRRKSSAPHSRLPLKSDVVMLHHRHLQHRPLLQNHQRLCDRVYPSTHPWLTKLR